MSYNIVLENLKPNAALIAHIHSTKLALEPLLDKNTEVLVSIFVSGDHLFNVTFRTKKANLIIASQSSHFNPYTAVTGATDSLQRRLSSLSSNLLMA